MDILDDSTGMQDTFSYYRETLFQSAAFMRTHSHVKAKTRGHEQKFLFEWRLIAEQTH